MIIPSFTCTKCDTINPELNANLRVQQVATTSNDNLRASMFDIYQVVVECNGCGKQKKLKVTP